MFYKKKAIATVDEKLKINSTVAIVLMNNTHRYPTTKRDPITPIFTEKELTFLQFCSIDLTYKEIASRMSISHRTVDNYRESLFAKLNIKSRTGLVVYGIKNGLIKI